MVAGVLDGGKGADDALIVCDVLVGVEGDVEVDLPVVCQLDLCSRWEGLRTRGFKAAVVELTYPYEDSLAV